MFIQLHNQYLPLSFKCLSEIDNTSKFSLRLSFAWIKMFTELCTFTLGKKSPRQSKPLFCLASAFITGFLKNLNKLQRLCVVFILHPGGINPRESRDISKRMNYDCFQSLFFRQLLQEVYSLRKSPFIVIHISGDFDQTILQTQLP